MSEKIHFLFDTCVLDRSENVKTISGNPVKEKLDGGFCRNEITYCTYPNVFWDPEIEMYRCYYTVLFGEHPKTALAYAQSADGVHWQFPDVGIQGNLLRISAHGSTVFYDKQEQNPEKKYKLLTRNDEEPAAMVAAFSADGIRFSEYIPLNLDPAVIGDTHNFCFYDTLQKCYRLISRTFDGNIRLAAGATSQDFINWSPIQTVFQGDNAWDQAYTLTGFIYGERYFAVASIYHGLDKSEPKYDKLDSELLYSVTGNAYHRLSPHQSFIPLGESYDSACIYCGTPVERDEEFWFYYTGANGVHTVFREADLHLARVPKRKIAGVTTRNQEEKGIIKTKPIKFQHEAAFLYADMENTEATENKEIAANKGLTENKETGNKELTVNVQIRLLDEQGKQELDGYGFQDFTYENDQIIPLKWGGKGVPVNQPVVMELVFSQAILYQIFEAEYISTNINITGGRNE